MRREACFKKFNVPSYLKRWVNFKKVFPLHLFDKNVPEKTVTFVRDVKKPVISGMPDMIQACGLELVGKHHSGIDDARNIASCVVKTLEQGFEFHQGMVHSHPFNPTHSESQQNE